MKVHLANKVNMKAKIIILLYFGFQLSYMQAQNIEISNSDSVVSSALLLSEKALYEAQFSEAREIVRLSPFKKLKDFNNSHEILLTIQDIRIESFMNTVYLEESNHKANFERLRKLLPTAQKIDNTMVRGKYFLALSNSFRAIGQSDSADIYQEKSLRLFEEIKDFEKVAEIRANDISRKHNQLLKEGKKEEILALIPMYKEEIEFSSNYSKYLLSYNTRHLAQIHCRQTLDYNEALRLFNESLNLRLEIGFKPFLPASYSSLGDVYMKIGEYATAIEMYLKSSELAQQIGFVRYQSYPILQIGDIYVILGQPEKASEYYLQALKIASENKYNPGVDHANEKINKND